MAEQFADPPPTGQSQPPSPEEDKPLIGWAGIALLIAVCLALGLILWAEHGEDDSRPGDPDPPALLPPEDRNFVAPEQAMEQHRRDQDRPQFGAHREKRQFQQQLHQEVELSTQGTPTSNEHPTRRRAPIDDPLVDDLELDRAWRPDGSSTPSTRFSKPSLPEEAQQYLDEQ